jgi:lauroyl/myristoyl acyltransferase
MDLPGRTPTRFLGRTVELANGTARLAKASDCLVVPIALVPRGRRFALRILEPVDPRDHLAAGDLHQTLATIHEKIVLAAPEHLENPMRAGGWMTADQGGRHAR